MKKAKLTIALAGNPNSGKTTIFNSLTGARQHVGNYPGVTVEKKEGYREYKGTKFVFIDLPGIYSVTANSLDELVARNFIINEKPDVIINVIDTVNIERNLYLTVQLLEMGSNAVLAFNMYDMTGKAGLQIDDGVIGSRLGIPVVRTVGNKNQGVQELMDAALSLRDQKSGKQLYIHYGEEIEREISQIEVLLAELAQSLKYPLRWLAVKLLENDSEIVKMINSLSKGGAILVKAEAAREEIRKRVGDDPELAIAQKRYEYVAEVSEAAVKRSKDNVTSVSDRIDRVITDRMLGLPIFLFLMWAMFNLVFTLGAYPQELIESGFVKIGDAAGLYLPDGELKSLIVDAIIGGVGGVLVFLPNIIILFLCISFLEDSGYMARAAFIMDRLMRGVGLHGKSFIPLILGFGCNVPAIMGTRTLENTYDRLITILVIPFMSCSARLPIYTVLTAAFFEGPLAGTILFSIYLFGIILAITVSLLLRTFLVSGDSEPFVMELPPYRVPNIKSLLTHMWERSVVYVNKAGTVILAASILVWFSVNFPADMEYSQNYSEKLSHSYSGMLGKAVEPLIQPLGFDWKIGVSLIAAFSAKEVLVSTLSTIYNIGQADDEQMALQQFILADPVFNPLVAYCLMVFVLIYAPCLATVAIIRRETNSWTWALFSACYSTVLAWLVTFAVYRIGQFFA